MIKKFISILICFAAFQTISYAADYYVDAERGNDSFAGTENAPFETIQKAVDSVSAGDIVYVRPGVYYGPINLTKKGTKNKPIVFRAVSQGENETIITNANRAIRESKSDSLWDLYDEENNIWVTDYVVQKNANIDWENPDYLFPARLLVDDVDLTAYTSLEFLRDRIYMKSEDSYMPGYPQGYYYDHSAGKLYIRLRTDGKYGSKNPNEHMIKVAPSYYTYISKSGGWDGAGWSGNAMGRDSYNFCIGEYNGTLAGTRTRAPSYYVEIDGFTFETPGFTGLFLRASDVTIKNCFFRGCRAGIRGASKARNNDLIYSDNVIIEGCDYSQFSTFDDAVDLIWEYVDKDKTLITTDYTTGETENYDMTQYFWWQRKSVNKNFNYEVGGFTNYMGTNWKIRYNYIHDCFDGFSCMSMLQYAINGVEIGSEYIEIYGNIFEKCLDNAIEIENHGRNIKVYENDFKNIFVPISWQPLGNTPWPTNIKFYKNVIHNTRDFNYFWKEKAEFRNYVFKFGSTNELAEGVNAFSAEDEGFWIFNNTIVSPGSVLFGNVSGSGRSIIPFENFHFVNNAVVCDVLLTKDNEPKIAYNDNTGIEFSHNIFALDNLKQYDLSEDSVLANKGNQIYNSENMGFKELTRLNLNPKLNADSPLIGAGVANRRYPEMSRDVGAYSAQVTEGL